MNPNWYEPIGPLYEGEALMWCDECEADTEHAITQWRHCLAYANCSECERETEVDPDGFDG